MSAHSSRPGNPRAIALELLISWEKGEEFAAHLIDRLSHKHQLSSRDTSLLQALVFATLRHLLLLDHWLEQLCNNRHLETRIHWQLRLGLAQLLLLDHAPHAAVNETVNLTQGKARSLINAILRRALREKDQLLAQIPNLPLHERHSHPHWLVERWQQHFGEPQTEQLLQWNQQPAHNYLRINKLHPDPVSSTDLTPASVPGFYLAENPPLDWLRNGQCYIQDPSTSHACQLLDPQPGELILDACAAPGGKTAYLAQMMQNQGRIVACDSSPRRLNRLNDNLLRLQVRIAEPMLQDWTQPLHPELHQLQSRFDRILIDTPCSNTGVMRRRLDVRWRIEPTVFSDMQQLQIQLTETVLSLLKPGGRLVYSTCSIDPEENEQVIQSLLSRHPELQHVESHTSQPWRDHADGAFAALLLKL